MAAKPAKSRKNARKMTGEERHKLAGRQHRPQILEYFADNHHRGLNRERVIRGVLEKENCPIEQRASTRAAIAKTLGRLVHDGYLVENLALGAHPRSARDSARTKRHRGYVAVTVSPSSIRDARLRKDEPIKSQEDLVQYIAEHTLRWRPDGSTASPLRGDSDAESVSKREPRWPREIILLDIAITHSADWDILISVSFTEADDFMQYVREVIQMTPHVTGTQTMFVAQSIAQIMESAQQHERAASLRAQRN
jgi:hypothetical protein